ncbi:MAG: hypothetical protein KAG26_02585, partial [Methylococcales bacterium]|nr:hypothetical protein [Methylococcales bacterium]
SSLDEESSIISSGINNQEFVNNNVDLAGFEDLPAKAMDSPSDYSTKDEDHLLDSIENFDLSSVFDEDILDDTQFLTISPETETETETEVNKETEPLGLNNAISLDSSLDSFDLGTLDDFENLDEMSVEETKIDLARAYIDMGDSVAAKSILEEIQDQGSEDQKIIAQKLLGRL